MYKNLIRLAAFSLLLSVAAGVANAEIIAYWPFEEAWVTWRRTLSARSQQK